MPIPEMTRRQWALAAAGAAALLAIVILVLAAQDSPPPAADSGDTTVASTSTTVIVAPGVTTTTSTSTPSGPTSPAHEPRYLVPAGEVEPEAKQLAADIAYALTTYEESDDATVRFSSIAGIDGLDLLAEAAQPLTHPGRWSRGLVVYPQLGGLTADRVSVMVVTRQTVGFGAETEFAVVRTLDIRLVRDAAGWVFDSLASAGGVFDSIEDLELAGAVASNPRIDMPDSARLDILAGGVSPILLQVMSEIAEITPYRITVMATGHPYHVFETGRVSHHTLGRAIDINRVGDRQVIDDRTANSATRALVQWLWENPMVIQVGSPWDVDGTGRSFANTVHQDHIHVAVIGPNDPTWVPAIGDLVWEDLDADGVQDPGEPGLGGVTVRLFDDSGTELDSTVTDSAGAYEFRNLSYGDYHVEVDIPAGFFASPRNQGSNDSVDSDIDGNGIMASTTLDPREHDPRWDAGLYRRASIGNLIWEDLDADGVQDPGEPGLGGVTVRLFNGAGSEVASTVTNGAGEYLFAGLTPGSYHVEVAIPGGYVASPRDAGSDAADSDIDSGGAMAATNLDSGEQDLGWDAGLSRPASLGGLVWEDLDANGIQDPGEAGLVGITVRLFNGASVQVSSTVTDAAGEYLFSGLTPGSYHVEVEIPDGLVASPQDQGPDDEADSDIDEDGVMESTNLAPSEDDRRWDAGLHL